MKLADWATIEELSLLEAAILLAGKDPSPLRGLKHQDSAIAHLQELGFLERKHNLRIEHFQIDELKRAVQSRVLPASRVTIKGFSSVDDYRQIDPATVGAHEIPVPALTYITKNDFLDWCRTRAKPIPAPFVGGAEPAENYRAGHQTIPVPIELRAAMEAFTAISGDQIAIAKRSPKRALLHWLATNKPELSSSARERIATVANWQPSGGAPKTLGG